MVRVLTPFACLVAALAVAGAGAAKETFDLKGEVYATGFKIEMKNSANGMMRGSFRVTA